MKIIGNGVWMWNLDHPDTKMLRLNLEQLLQEGYLRDKSGSKLKKLPRCPENRDYEIGTLKDEEISIGGDLTSADGIIFCKNTQKNAPLVSLHGYVSGPQGEKAKLQKLETAAKNGSCKALMDLFQRYSAGSNEVYKDSLKASRFFFKALRLAEKKEQGTNCSPEIKLALAKVLVRGMPAPFSISKNWARAEKLLAGMDKNKEALELLADMYLKGNENFPKSISKAREFYRISIKLGNKTAEKKLKNILTE